MNKWKSVTVAVVTKPVVVVMAVPWGLRGDRRRPLALNSIPVRSRCTKVSHVAYGFVWVWMFRRSGRILPQDRCLPGRAQVIRYEDGRVATRPGRRVSVM